MTRVDLALLAPVLIPLLGGVLTLIADAAKARRLAISIGFVALAVGAGVAVWAAQAHEARPVQDIFGAGGGLSTVAAVVLIVAAATVLGGWSWFATSPMGGGAVALVLFVAAASVGLSGSLDLLLTIICLESLALGGYALTAQARTKRSAEASVKYVVQGSVTTGLLVLGFALLFGVYGTRTGLYDIGVAIGVGPRGPALAALGFVAGAFAYKLGAFPFHSWAPDVFETAPPASAGAMATVPKIGAVTAALLVFSVAFGAAGTDRLPLMWTLLAGGSIVVGNLVALRQTSYTRMLGYSGIAQIGYVLVGFAASSATASAVLVLISAYGFAASAAFLGAEAVAVCHPDWDGSIAGMAGMGRTRPILGIALTVAMFSLTGMPLTLGFWGKLGVFGPAVASGDTMLVSIAVVGILGSVVSFGYYGGVLRTLFFETPAEEESPGSGEGDTLAAQEAHAHAVGGGQRVNVAEAVAAAIGAFVLVLGVYPLFEGLDWLMGLFA